MINKRIFGTPLTGKVRDKLEQRQTDGGEIQFGDILQTASGKISKNVELSSRTPFVRMWTALKLIEPEQVADAMVQEIYPGDYSSVEDARQQANTIKKDKLGTEYTVAEVNEIVDSDGDVIKFVIREKGTRDKVDYLRKIYEVGNYAYQQSYGQVDANEVINDYDFGIDPDTSFDLDDKEDELLDELEKQKIFTQELANNKYLKPQSGITSVRIETQGALGTIKKTTVNFLVHNFYDFDRIYNKYFLKPGATIFVDYGWSSIERLYDQEELIQSTNIQEYLYGEVSKGDPFDGVVTENQGDLDVIQGLVTDYNAKILPNGSVECSVTLTSANSAILNFKTPEDFVDDRLKPILTRGVIFYGVSSFLKDKVSNDDLTEFNEYFTTPNLDTSAEDEEAYEDKLNKKAVAMFSGGSGPDGESVRQGVYITDLASDDIYISWGLFEDLIINTQFGFGQDKEEISKGTAFQVRMDSSESYTNWSKVKENHQSVALKDSQITNPNFLYPLKWGKTVNSYSWKNGKYPRAENSNNLGWKKNQIEKIIPLREVFIHQELIVKAFEEETDVKRIIRLLLNKINTTSDGLFDWQMTSGDIDSQIKIVDSKFVEAEQRLKFEAQSEDERFNRFFKFKVMSKNSMIKDYNLELKLPSGDMANYYALQALSHDSSLFSVKAGAVNALNTLYGTDAKQMDIIYEPDNGSYRAEQSVEQKSQGNEFNVFNTIKRLMGSEVSSTIKSVAPTNKATPANTNPKANKTTPQIKISEGVIQKLVDRNQNREEAAGKMLAGTIDYYFNYQVFEKDVEPQQSTLMPYYLSLTIYGIASIVPGDTFTVDYLPIQHLRGSYLQTMTVVHELNSSGWFTTLETQFRNNFVKVPKKLLTKPIAKTNVRLSPRALNVVLKGTAPQFYSEKGTGKGTPDKFFNKGFPTYKKKYKPFNFEVDYLAPFITNATIKRSVIKTYENRTELTDIVEERPGYIVEFRTPDELDPALEEIKSITFQSLYAELATKRKDGLLEIDLEVAKANKKLLRDRGEFGLASNPKMDKPTFDTPFTWYPPDTYAAWTAAHQQGMGKPLIQVGEGETYVEGSTIKTRIYPPSVIFRPKTNYTMLIVDGNYAIFDNKNFDRAGMELNAMLDFFTKNSPAIENQ